MIRMIVRIGILLAANAVGLIVASLVLDGVRINVASFVVAVAIFTGVLALLQPFFAVQLRKRNSAALGGVALIATLAALIVTDLISDGLSISGIGNWIAATVIVWAVALLAAFVLPYLGLRKYLEQRGDGGTT